MLSFIFLSVFLVTESTAPRVDTKTDTLKITFQEKSKETDEKSLVSIYNHAGRILLTKSIIMLVPEIKQKQNLADLTEKRIDELKDILYQEGGSLEKIQVVNITEPGKLKKLGLDFNNYLLVVDKEKMIVNDPSCETDTMIISDGQPFLIRMRLCDYLNEQESPYVQIKHQNSEQGGSYLNEKRIIQNYSVTRKNKTPVKILIPVSGSDKNISVYLEKFHQSMNTWVPSDEKVYKEKYERRDYWICNTSEEGTYRLFSDGGNRKFNHLIFAPEGYGFLSGQVLNTDSIAFTPGLIYGGRAIAFSALDSKENYSLNLKLVSKTGEVTQVANIRVEDCYERKIKIRNPENSRQLRQFFGNSIPEIAGQLPKISVTSLLVSKK